ncbi:MAG: oligosaccharide flippase family protein [Lachnospiraceae bacterium]|nr:oligosaccharide flippase family protein [Lachnospiraceae bacterium]
MAKEKPIAYNMLLNGLLKVSSYIFPLVAFPYVSRVLLPEGIGRVSFAISFITYFSMLAQMGIPTYGIQACARVHDNKTELSRTFHELFFINVIMASVSYIIFIISLLLVPRLQEDKTLFMAMSVMIVLNVIGIEWLYQATGQYAYITTRALFFKIVSIPLLFILVRGKQDYVFYGILVVFASRASNILNFIHARKIIFVKWLGSYNVKRHIKQIFVLFAVSCATLVYTNLDTFMLGMIKGAEETGYYEAAVKIKVPLADIVTATGIVLLPHMSYYLEKGMKEEFFKTCKKAVNAMILAALPVSVYFSVFAEECIRLLSGPAYSKAVIPMQIIMPAVLLIGLTNIIGIQMLVAMGREKNTLYSVIAGALTDLVLNVFFIPAYGAAGAAAGTLIAEVVVLLVQYNYIKKTVAKLFAGFNWKLSIPACLTAVILTLWVKFINIPAIFSLAVSSVIFFGSYAGILLWKKEPFIVEVTGKLKKVLEKVPGRSCQHNVINKPEMRINMKQRNYYFKNIADSFIKHCKIIIPFIILCTLGLSVLGYRQSRQVKSLTPEQQEEVDLYNEQLAAYDKQIEESQKNIETIQQEINKLQKYIDESIYMKLEPLNLHLATAQYAVTDTLNTSYVISSMTNYLAYGNIQEILEKEYGTDEAGYIREILSWPVNGNLLNITITHYDKEKGKEILAIIQKSLESYIPEIAKVQGKFTFKKLETRFYTKKDNDVTNVQNSKMDTLKNYNVSLADYNTRVASNKNSKANYIEENQPEVMEAVAPGKILVIKYAVFGIILGIVLPFAIISLRYILSSRIRSARELINSEIPVFPCSSSGSGEKPDISLGIAELKLLVQKYGADSFFLNILSGNDKVKSIVEDITETFKQSGVVVETGVIASEDARSLEHMVQTKYVVIVVKAGENTYPQLASQIGACKKFGVSVWGCIAVE